MTSPAHAPPPSPDSTLLRAESEAGALEAALRTRLEQAQDRQRTCEQRLAAVQERLRTSELNDLDSDRDALEAARPSPPSTAALARAREAREAALLARQAAAAELEASLAAHEQSIDHALELAETLEHRLAEAEAQLAAEREAEAARQAAAERASAASAAQDEDDAGSGGPAHQPNVADTMISRAPGMAPPLHPALRQEQPKRSSKRVTFEAAIDLGSDSNFFTGFSTNLSEGGVFVTTLAEVPLGTQVELSLSLPGQKPIPLKGTVRWTREHNDLAPKQMPGVGVQFAELPQEAAQRINAFVQQREPLFFPS